jgi:enamine deaminase RidA (YjgF/YER057c/UK114 family)
MSSLPALPSIPPGRYRHYKGGEYEVLGVVRHSESLEPMVLYRPLYNESGMWVRPHAMFLEQIEFDGTLQPRFAPVGGETSVQAASGERMRVQRWSGSATGRNRAVAFGDLVWTVANATDTAASFEGQAAQTLRMLESHLVEAGSARTHLLSLQVLVADIADRGTFDRLWQEWIGPNPAHWPQRACFQSALAPGLLVELIAVAAPRSVGQVARRGATDRQAP